MSGPTAVDAGATVKALPIERLLRSADFERVLRTRTRWNTEHFALHHVADRPSVPARWPASKLSTGGVPNMQAPVDDLLRGGSQIAPTVSTLSSTVPPATLWLGVVVPKRHARRSVTRTLLKRQVRAAVTDRAEALPGGLWVVRLRAPFDRKHFVSAASDALRQAARHELDQLLRRAATGPAPGR